MPPGPSRSATPWTSRRQSSPAPTRPGRSRPTWPARLISPHAQRAEHRDRARGPGGWPTLSCPVLTSMPGIGVPAAAVLPAETPGRTPATRAQPASYAGLAPVTRRPGSSIRGERRLPRRQQAAQDSHVRLRLRLPALRPRLQGLLPAQTRPGKRPGQAVTALAHRRVPTLNAMIRDGALYDPQPAAQLPTTA